MEKRDILKEYKEYIKPYEDYKDMISKSLLFLRKHQRSSPLELQKIIDSLLPLAKKEKDLCSLAGLQNLKGWTLLDVGDYKEAKIIFEKSKTTFHKINDHEGIVRTLNSLGYYSITIGNATEAIKYFDEALELALAHDLKESFAALYGNLGETFQKIGNYEESLDYYKKGLSLSPDQTNKAVILEGLASSYYQLGKYDEALPYLLEALEIVNANGLMLIKSHILASLGEVYKTLGQTSEAVNVLLEAKELAKTGNLPKFEGDTYLALGRIFMEQGEYKEAEKYFKIALEIGQEINEISLRAQAVEMLSSMSESQKDWEKAYSYFVEYYEEIEKLANEKTAKEIQRLKLNEANREIELLTKMHQQVSTISQMGKEITSSLNLEEILFTIYNILAELMDIKVFGVGFYRERRNELIIQLAVRHNERLEPIVIDLNRLDSFAARSFKDNKEIIINDLEKEYSKYIPNIYPQKPKELEDVQSLIFLPLEVNNRQIGVVTVQSASKEAYDEYKLEMIKALASYIAIALENSNLYEKVEKMATSDAVTNLYNRAHFINLAEKEFKKYKRNGPVFSLIMFDLDHFKEINDQYGHDVGDITLRQVAYECKERLRESDLFSRYGGDEFMILLPMTNQSQAKIVAESLLHTIRKMKIRTEEGESFTITASFGLASVDEEDLNLKDLLKKVDLALYQAKNKGRNRLSSY